jgi:hypothetical protein
MKDFGGVEVFDGEDMSQHYGDEDLPDVGLQNVVKSFALERINFIKGALGPDVEKDSFVDLGDSDGIFLKALGKKGLSVNISLPPLENIRDKGLDGIMADIGKLPIKDGAFDHILFFQALEHMPCPIGSLKEINRICNRSAFVSIPYVSRTIIHRYNYDPGIPIFQHHIFEFDEADFRKVVTHAGFKVASVQNIAVFDRGTNLIDKLVFAIWNLFRGKDMFCGCFQKFALYHLVKE